MSLCKLKQLDEFENKLEFLSKFKLISPKELKEIVFIKTKNNNFLKYLLLFFVCFLLFFPLAICLYFFFFSFFMVLSPILSFMMLFVSYCIFNLPIKTNSNSNNKKESQIELHFVDYVCEFLINNGYSKEEVRFYYEYMQQNVVSKEKFKKAKYDEILNFYQKFYVNFLENQKVFNQFYKENNENSILLRLLKNNLFEKLIDIKKWEFENYILDIIIEQKNIDRKEKIAKFINE